MQFMLIYMGSAMGLIALMTYVSVKRMTNLPELREVNDGADTFSAHIPAAIRKFLESNDFEFSQAYKFHNVRVGIWRSRRTNGFERCLSVMTTVASSSYELISIFSDTGSLTTTKSRSAFFFPRPYGSFMQAFPNRAAQELLAAHVEGENYLINERLIDIQPRQNSFTENFRLGALRQFALIRSLSFWPFRGIYWFLLKRFLLQNKPIWKQPIISLYPRVSEPGTPDAQSIA
jgi:hypothetical protein